MNSAPEKSHFRAGVFFRLSGWMAGALASLLLAVPCSWGRTSFVLKSHDPDSFATSTVFDASKPLIHHAGSNDLLYFSYAAIPGEPKQDRTFRFKIILVSGKKDRVLFEKEISPDSDPSATGWHRECVSLAEFAGQDVVIKFSSTRMQSGKSLASPPDALFGGVRIGDFTRRAEYNVILISIDTLRWDRLGISGNPRQTSPSIDKLAREGVYFKRAVANASWTKPSHMSVFTGLYPSVHGIQARWNLPGGRDQLPSSIRALPEEMRDGGYITQAFTGSGNISAVFGFDRGFDEFREVIDTLQGDGHFVFRNGIRWIEKHADEKFFLFLHTYEVHAPYRRSHFVDPQERDKTELLKQRYDSGIYYTDRLIGRLRQFLENRELLDHTIIVIFSDHGEGLDDRPSAHRHGRTLFDELILVPVIFRAPALFLSKMHGFYQAQLVDLMPTILDLVGLRVPPDLDGVSLLPILKGGALPARSFGVSELTHPFQSESDTGIRIGMTTPNEGVLRTSEVPKKRPARMRILQTIRMEDPRKQFKLIYSPGFSEGWDDGKRITSTEAGWMTSIANHGRQFFDLRKDPGERTPLPVKDSETAAMLERMLLELIGRHARSQDSETSHENEKAVSPELKERLRSLGY